MEHHFKKIIFALRVCLGWLFLYAGLSHAFTTDWSAKGYLLSAMSFHWFYTWLASPNILPFINALNIWALILLGFSLISGAFVRLSAPFGMLLMFLYYLPILSFPYVGSTSFLVDEHIIFILVLVLIFEFRAGRFWGFDEWTEHASFWKKYPALRDVIS
jgi:thiosulfate dehydrogenase [quinone] large subunit